MSKIVLVHGLFMPGLIMQYLYRHLKKNGYDVYIFSYNTFQFEQGVDRLNDSVVQGGRVYFVGHSLGGLLIRRYFEKYNPKFQDSCIVTLGTPHNGSIVAKKIMEKTSNRLFLKTSDILSNGLKYQNTEVDIGLIIGSLNIGVGNVFKNKNGDGVVLLEESILEGAKDTVVINSNHTGLVYSKEAVMHIVRFIKERKF